MLLFFLFFFRCAIKLEGGAAYWPKLICVIGAVLSTVNAALAGVKWKKADEHATAVFPLSLAQIKRSTLMLAIAAIWIFAIPYVGYLTVSTIATVAIVVLFEPLNDKKHIARDIVITLIFSFVIYQLFVLLGVHFPKAPLI